jgi:hypothetical protein
LGSLIYINKAISPARLFVNRIIALLKIAPESGFVYIGADFYRDLEWFVAFAHLYNGYTRFNNIITGVDYELYVDASFSGLGGCYNNIVYTLPINAKGENIAHWEALNVLFALRTWAHKFASKSVRIHCDNSAAVAIFNTARGSDLILQAVAQNIWLLAATYDMKLTFEHIRGEHNKVADLLSRWSVVYNPIAKLYSLLNEQPIWTEVNREYLLLNWSI